MVLPLRRRHRRIFAVIGVLLPVAFVTGVAARKPVPTTSLQNGLPYEPTFLVSQWDRRDLFTNLGLGVQFLRDASNTNRAAIRISVPKDFVKADLLVYWLSAESRIKDTIPDDAILFGAFDSDRLLSVPAGIGSRSGFLVLYSLADHAIVAVSTTLMLPMS